jgi:hypothetical protein
MPITPLAVVLGAAAVAAADAPYNSAFEGYRPFEATQVQDWRQSNETVRAIGGWRAYAREIQGGGPAPAARVPASGATPADPHQGHHK